MAQDRTQDRTQTQPKVDMREDRMPPGQAPARPQQGNQQQGQRLTAVQQAAQDRYRVKTQFIDAAIANRQAIERSLNLQGLTWDEFMASLEIGLTNTMKNNPDFFEKATVQSFIEAVITAAHFGIKPDGKEGAIVCYGTVAQFMPMVEGFIKKLWQTGAVKDINHNVVRDGDVIDYNLGDDGYVRHRPPLKRVQNADTIAAWCVINLVTGGKIIEICDDQDLKEIAAVSRATKGPRKDWADEMHRKGPFRRALKRMPKDKGIGELIAHDDIHYTLGAPRLDTLPAAGQRARHARSMDESEMFEDKRAVVPAAEEQAAAEDEPETQAQVVQGLVTAILHTEDLVALYDVADPIDERDDFGSFTREELDWLGETITNKAREFGVLPVQDEHILDTIYRALPEEEKAEVDGEEQAGEGEPLPPNLAAILAHGQGPRFYPDEEAELWKSDFLAKFSTLKGDQAGSFWKTNQAYVLFARDHGFQGLADKILKVATERGFYKEGGDV